MNINCRRKLGNIFTLLLIFFLTNIQAQQIDLSLALNTNQNGFLIYSTVPVSLEITNSGNTTATDIAIEFQIPSGAVYSSDNASTGSYNPWSGEWIIDQLPAGASHQLNLNLFTLTADSPLICFAQVDRANEQDIDSTPGNNQTNQPNEDDEALLLIDPNGNSGSVNGTTEFSIFPTNFQFFARDLSTNEGTVEIAGTVTGANAYEALRTKVFRNNVLQNTQDHSLTFNGEVADFQLLVPIAAELANFKIELYGINGNSETYLNSAEDLVAGDVYLVNGQSNAQALVAPALQDVNNFTRSYSSTNGWTTLQFSNPGMWAARIAKNISEDYQIPVAVFNEAVGAQGIDFYLKNDAIPYSGNYGTLLQRMEEAGLSSQVRAMLWFQGETDGWVTDPEIYKQKLGELYADWVADYQITDCFLYQLRYQSCSHPRPLILEAQRQIGREETHFTVMSTSNANHDGCHFEYTDGYQDLGDRMYKLVANRLYSGNFTNATPPDVIKIESSSSNEVIITFSEDSGDLSIEGYPWEDFVIEGTSARVISGIANGNKLILTLSGSSDGMTGISYLCHPGNAANWIYNSTGVGLMSFYNLAPGEYPLDNNTTPPNGNNTTSNGLDLEIGIEALTPEYNIYENITYTITISNTGTEMGEDIIVDCPYPDGLVYTDAAVTQGDFSAWLQEWNLGNLAPGESAVLNLTLFTLVSDIPLTSFVQIKAAAGDDIDSSPGNNQDQIATEDDEASITVYPLGNTPGGTLRLTQLYKNIVLKRAFPIPAQDFLQLHIESKEATSMELQIVDILGKTIAMEKVTLTAGQNLIPLEVDQLQDGYYFLYLKGAHSKYDVLKFQKIGN